MNWRITSQAKDIGKAELQVEHAEDEDPKATPDSALVKYARTAASTAAAKLGGKDHHVEVHGHETTKGEGFKPGHISITISRLDQ